MSFLDDMENTLHSEYGTSITENGAVGFSTTRNPVLDMNFKISSYRKASEDTIIKDFEEIFKQDEILAMQFLFYIRDREEGLQERRLFKLLFKYLATAKLDFIQRLIPVVPDYGRFDDLFVLFDTPAEKDMLKFIQIQLDEDIQNMSMNKPISLLAKWLPSINLVSTEKKIYQKELREAKKKEDKEQIELITTRINSIPPKRAVVQAKKIAHFLGYPDKRYRVTLSKLRKYIDVTERKMCAKEWDKIKYETVPSKANLKYRKAFLRNDQERREKFLESLSKGETKINAKKLFPYEVYVNASRDDKTTEELWKNLPKINNDTGSVLVVADGSGSMSWTNLSDKGKVTALDISNSLAIYFAEQAKGEFHNSYITFSSDPIIVKLTGSNLYENKRIAEQHCDCSNTNIEKTFDLILNTAVKHEMKQEEMPSTVIIISDMEFDRATTGRVNKTLFQEIESKFNQYNYKLPRLVFWNVLGRTSTIPVVENDLGVALVSGFSTSIFDMILNNDTDPFQTILRKLNTPRYTRIKEILN